MEELDSALFPATLTTQVPRRGYSYTILFGSEPYLFPWLNVTSSSPPVFCFFPKHRLVFTLPELSLGISIVGMALTCNSLACKRNKTPCKEGGGWQEEGGLE